MSTGVIDGTEEQALASGGGPDTLVPGYAWQAQQLADSLLTHSATLDDAAVALARIEITDWRGAASDSAHRRLGQQPTRWATAATAFQRAATALTRYADAFPPARQLATDAALLYGQYVDACTTLATGLAVTTGGEGIGERVALLLTAGARPDTHDAARAADALRRSAIDTLARARTILRTAGDDAAATLTSAVSDAPQARTFWQATIRPPGAEDAAHHTLEALSFVPGWVGATAALVDAGWFLTEGRHDEAAWAAAGAVPLLGRGLQEGLATREVMTQATPAVEQLAAAAARRIGAGHAWTKHVLEGGEFPEVQTQSQLQALVEDVLLHGEAHPSSVYPGKTYYWKDGTFVVIDPRNPDGGTVFRPRRGYDYFLEQD